MNVVRFAVLFSALVVAQAAPLSAGSGRSKPVMVGGDAIHDACGGVGKVVGLDPKGDNFLAVRAGPGSKYRVIDKIKMGQAYVDCDSNGSWVGIVYSRDKQEGCGLGSTIAKKQPYRGRCKSGWVFRKYTELVAG